MQIQKSYIIGKPKKENPIKLKILDKKLTLETYNKSRFIFR